jgi:DNA replication and repair protein RecF
MYNITCYITIIIKYASIHPMHITKLNLTTFRNIASTSIKIDDAKVIAVVGENGAGKTNMLEAISMLSPGNGLHKAKRDLQIQNGLESWGIHAHISNPKPHTVGMAFEKSNGKRQIKIDNEKAELQSDLSGIGSILWFTPRMDRLFLDNAQARREFFDRLVFSLYPEHAKNLTRYRHHLKNRLKLLKTNANNNWLEIEEEQATEFAIKIIENRSVFLEKLQQHLPEVELMLTGSAHKILEEDKPYDEFLKHLVQNRERDKLYGSSNFGPHRTDITGTIIQENILLNQTSTGQHKKAILYILLANARLNYNETGITPLILLDEITAHLDETVKATLFKELNNMGTQIWMTGTEESLFNGLNPDIFIHVNNGNFST